LNPAPERILRSATDPVQCSNPGGGARSVTRGLRDLHRAITAARDGGPKLAVVWTTWRLPTATTSRLLFMAVVTCYLLGRIFAGAASPVETFVYGATAAFGLEFLIAAWRDLWQRG
jgi:hypothetical protein